jgi:hypothetical protein
MMFQLYLLLYLLVVLLLYPLMEASLLPCLRLLLLSGPSVPTVAVKLL